MNPLPLHFPELTRDQLNCCETRLEAVEQWLQHLPLAHPPASAEKLNTLLQEFNQLRLLPPRRLEWLDKIAPVAVHTLGELDQGPHLHQEGELSQQLQEQLAQSYKRCINDLLALRDQLPTPILARSLLASLHAALLHGGALILRACKLSVAAPEYSWPELNLLYHIASQSRLQHKKIQQQQPNTCEAAYLQVVLLGLIQAETLRPDELQQLWPLLASWAALVQILPADAPERLFQVVTNNGWQPQRSQPLEQQPTERDLGLNTLALTSQLSEHLQQGNDPLGNRLIQHLLACLGEPQERSSPRVASSGDIQLALGLRSVHYHLNNRQPFETLIAGQNFKVNTQNNPFIKEDQPDPWASAPDAVENKSIGTLAIIELDTEVSTSVENALDRRYPIHQLQLVNTSATGYCLLWPGQAPPQLRTGELIALQERTGTPWQPGMIRWIRDVKEGQQLGIERLGGRLQPCAIKPVIKIGPPADYLPGFLLPELKVLGVPASVITPLLPFKEGQKVEVSSKPQGVQRARLAELLSSPGEFQQFSLENIGHDDLRSFGLIS
ncbi:hypothetical protein [Marinospirillum alkaliphilum]|uniref:Molecular chaperone n=1 Tax=Marinospirillum alkaliphilum DSM 21637 TaxID=1122209 RepID=A0A1K1V7G5_9GAMM|nr:hypothetical protein [Marinospirillum alkaliphilum]SFX21097.1 hypothetical protein SAMN02745752_00820 [Marinospirillum alkaliphilum DSM 21637]